VDAAAVISANTRKRVQDILESDREMEDLTSQIIVLSARNDSEHARRCELLLSKLRQGFLQAP
jgi:predicted transcriptional regulator